MTYSDPHEHAPRRPRYAKDLEDESLFSAVNEVLARGDLPVRRCSIEVSRLPIIYIVGTPRSGTTLVSQLLSRYLPLGYVNNLIARFWLRPSVGIRLSQALLGKQGREGISFQSTHGLTEEIGGPHEFGYFWRHWLRLDSAPNHHLSKEALDRLDRAGLKQVLEQEILGTFGTGVIFKNVICGFHAGFLTGLHPTSLFVHIKRDPLATAASILATRRERFGSYDVWWSLKPSTYPCGFNHADPAADVAKQVLDCRREMDEELSKEGVNHLDVTYEDLCADPALLMKGICAWVQEKQFDLQPVSAELPTFRASEPARLPAELESRLRTALLEAVSE